MYRIVVSGVTFNKSEVTFSQKAGKFATFAALKHREKNFKLFF